MSQVFDSYAQYYDLLYQDKNYGAEVEYITRHIQENAPKAKSILELGCGTGAHAEHLARLGYTVHGVDMSKEMLMRAEVRKAGTEKKYDVVMSLFHVMSYHSSNDDLVAAFETAATHLSSGGVFLYDFWYGPAVLTQSPDTRVKRLENNEIKVTRIAEPVMHVNENIVDVNYDVFIEQKDTGDITQVKEKHTMRYLFLPELECFQTSKIWSDYKSYEWLEDNELSDSCWAGFIVAICK